MKQLHDWGVPVTLDVLGDGPNRESLMQKSRQLNLSEHIYFHGNVDFPEQFLCKANIYIHTASYEPLGLVLIEAMAAGLPVVCTDGKGNVDLMKEGENGFVIWERDVEQFAGKVKELIENQELREKISQSAHAESKRYDIKLYVDKLLALYRA